MESNRFSKVAIHENNPKWKNCLKREDSIYPRKNDIRSEFVRDYNRILHCTAYRRLKHKTQIFFATKNDHICTRIEHVNHVASVSDTISRFLGLNTELTKAIAVGHDVGHAPFGHEGEIILKEICERELRENFWHEKNSLWFVDKLETLQDPLGKERNLNLTYAVRDGIVSHCGEVNENAIFPREEAVNLNDINESNQYSPYTWEGCVVKISDKISFIGRDIEDALALKFLSNKQIKELINIIRSNTNINIKEINNTTLMHEFIINLCESSSPEVGIKFSEKYLKLLNLLRDFSYKNIYFHPRLDHFKKYAKLIIEAIFSTSSDFYKKKDTLTGLKKYEKEYPLLISTFSDWLIKYSDSDIKKKKFHKYENEILFKMNSTKDYLLSTIYYISGMTDSFAIKVFDELTSF